MHVLVKAGKPSKDVPCVVCGAMCRVHIYYATKWVKCPEHMKASTRAEKRSGVLDPFEDGIELEDRVARCQGAILELHREEGNVKWNETVTITSLVDYDEQTGLIKAFGYGGTAKPGYDKATGHRECGQHLILERKEVIACR